MQTISTVELDRFSQMIDLPMQIPIKYAIRNGALAKASFFLVLNVPAFIT